MSAPYFTSSSLVRRIRNFVYDKTRKISGFQNNPETAQTTCLIMSSMSVAHPSSFNPARQITNFVH